jgi:EAL domain-containing protein (putative c-di-GMP-specific phosphodiesterase class I)
MKLVYQPIVDAATERLSGFEALIRWIHPTLGNISPDIFIPIAEEANLIGRIGEWVVRTACAEASDWPDEIRIAVNLSPSQFVDANLPAMIFNALAASGLPAGRLELELTEGVFLNENSVTASTLAALNGMGVHLAMDDFGTGYSSLGYLRRASFSKIKIDRSFVRGVAGRNRDNIEIVRAVVTIAKSLGMITTAEGAETAEEVQALRELGCTQIQGFFYGEPLETEKARKLIASHSNAPRKRDLTPRSARIQILRAAQLRAGRKKYQVLVKNLSAEGAMIQIEEEIKAGTKLILELSGFDPVKGVVRWTQPHKIGIAFDERIDLDNLRQISWLGERRSLERSRKNPECKNKTLVSAKSGKT